MIKLSRSLLNGLVHNTVVLSSGMKSLQTSVISPLYDLCARCGKSVSGCFRSLLQTTPKEQSYNSILFSGAPALFFAL
jgi:hypothetical protein